MTNPASFFVLLFLAITFLMSSHEKVFHWKTTLQGMQSYFANSPVKDKVALLMGVLLVTELIAGILAAIGCLQLYINGERNFGFWGAVFSCIALLEMLIGQRLAKDYDGARNITLYFIPAVIGVYWLS